MSRLVLLTTANCLQPRRRAECPPMRLRTLLLLGLVLPAGWERSVRFASFNAPLSREHVGWLLYNLNFTDDAQAKSVADVIQRVNPDVLLLSDIDDEGLDRIRSFFGKH